MYFCGEYTTPSGPLPMRPSMTKLCVRSGSGSGSRATVSERESARETERAGGAGAAEREDERRMLPKGRAQGAGWVPNARARGADCWRCIMRTREILAVLIAPHKDEQESSDCGQSTSLSNDMHVLCVVCVDGRNAPDRWGNFK
eukprot:1336254-Rhodomonas_salina.1